MKAYYESECKCGHERDSHYDKHDNCLAMHCDCIRFRGVNTQREELISRRGVNEPDTIPPPPETEPQTDWDKYADDIDWPFGDGS